MHQNPWNKKLHVACNLTWQAHTGRLARATGSSTGLALRSHMHSSIWPDILILWTDFFYQHSGSFKVCFKKINTCCRSVHPFLNCDKNFYHSNVPTLSDYHHLLDPSLLYIVCCLPRSLIFITSSTNQKRKREISRGEIIDCHRLQALFEVLYFLVKASSTSWSQCKLNWSCSNKVHLWDCVGAWPEYRSIRPSYFSSSEYRTPYHRQFNIKVLCTMYMHNINNFYDMILVQHVQCLLFRCLSLTCYNFCCQLVYARYRNE